MGLGRCTFTEIEAEISAVARARDHKSAPAEVARLREGDSEDEACGSRRIECGRRRPFWITNAALKLLASSSSHCLTHKEAGRHLARRGGPGNTMDVPITEADLERGEPKPDPVPPAGAAPPVDDDELPPPDVI